MSLTDKLRALVPDRIFDRGLNYYRDGRVSNFKSTKVSPTGYRIKAVVRGVYKYRVELELQVINRELYFDHSCTCPYDWGDICKHTVAVVYKFIKEEYREKKYGDPRLLDYDLDYLEPVYGAGPGVKKPGGTGAAGGKKARETKSRAEEDGGQLKKYQLLFELSRPAGEEDNSLRYLVNGLLNGPKPVNFKVTLQSDVLAAREINQLIKGIYHPARLSREDSPVELLSRQDYEDLLAVIGLEPDRGYTPDSFLLTKNKESLAFLLGLMERGQVVLEETGEEARPGEVITPSLLLSGNEDRVAFSIKEELEIFQARDTDLGWTVIESTVHPVDLEQWKSLPREVRIPPERKGEFLFEVIPGLRQKLPLEVAPELAEQELLPIEPEIELEFDSDEGAVFCRSKVRVGESTFKGTEILALDPGEKIYTPAEDNPGLWYCEDKTGVGELISFLEGFEFHVCPGGFVLRDRSDIQEFITAGFLHLPEDWEVRTTAAFDRLEIKEVELEPVIEFKEGREGAGIDWFEFEISYNLGGQSYTRKELQEMISYNSRGQAYINIGSQYFVLQDGDKEKGVRDFLNLARDRKEGGYQSNYYNLLYYRSLMEEKGISFKGNRVFNELNRDITEENLVSKTAVPGEVENILRPYQKRGYYWLRFLHKYRFGGILADDMGLGKTVQTLTLLKSVKSLKPVVSSAGEAGEGGEGAGDGNVDGNGNGNGEAVVNGEGDGERFITAPALVICPRTLIHNWGEEVEKFFPGLRYLVYYGSPAEREEMRSGLQEYDLVITSYSIISRDYQELNEMGIVFSYCILDEAQHIKNHKTKRARGVKGIQAERKLALTGTPLENSLDELWSIFDFLMSGYLGGITQFRKKYLNPIKKNNDLERLEELKRRVAPFILRRKKEEVLTDLPEKIVNIHPVEMTRLQEDSYRLILEDVRGELVRTVQEKGFNRSRINVLAALTRLRQICNHPSLALDRVDRKQGSGKLDSLLEMIEEAVDGGHKLLVFSQFVRMLKLIRAALDKKGISYEYLDGGTRDRMERVKRFNEDDGVSLFLISLKAGGLGINLTAADMVIHVDPWWNPMVERQATDRAHRLGQEKRVMVYKLITRGTVEEKMLKLQERKQAVFDSILENNNDPMAAITWEDIQELLEIPVS